MILQLYKPNPKNTGCAASFQVSQKPNQEPVFYLNCIAQHSWNAQNKTGSFSESRNDPSKMVAVKFNEFELGEFINSINSNIAYSTFHSNDSTKTQIRLTPYEKTRGTGDYAIKCTAYGLSIVRNGSDTFKVPIDPGEAVRLTAFIMNYFKLVDDYRAANNQYTKQSGGQQKQPAKPQRKEEPKPEFEEVEF